MEKKVNSKSRMDASLHQGAQVVRVSLEWYRDKFHSTIKALIISGVINLILVTLVIIQLIIEPAPTYYAVTPDLRIMELQPLSEPYIRDDGLRDWASQTLISTFPINFRNWKQQLGSIRSRYDPSSFESLILSMKNNGILDLIENKRLICSATIQDPPVIHASGIQKGTYMWRIKMSILLFYESSEGIIARQNLDVDLLIQRASLLDYPNGINIKQIVMTAKR